MNARDFYFNIAAHKDLEWLGVRETSKPETDEVLIRNIRYDIRFAVCVRAICNNTWEELQAVLKGERQPNVMIHVTRIVGYYSRLDNWNKSKIAELHDRHKGQYVLPEGDGNDENKEGASPAAVGEGSRELAGV